MPEPTDPSTRDGVLPDATEAADDLRAVAFHEAGHAVAAIAERRALVKVTIVPTDDNSGSTHYRSWPVWVFEPEDHGLRERALMEKSVITLFAGPEAEARFLGSGDELSPESGSDLEKIAEIVLRSSGSEAEANAYQAWLRERARNIVRSRRWWPCIEALAGALLERRTLSAPAARRVVHDALGLPRLHLADGLAGPHGGVSPGATGAARLGG